MMDDPVPFASPAYFWMLGLLVFGRGMDFLSTWIATPNLVLEGNPIAKKLGWKWGGIINGVLCAGFAVLPLAAIIIATTSVLVAARNFQNASFMRALGEEGYRARYVEHLEQTSLSLHVLCLFLQAALTAGVGAALIYFTDAQLVGFGVGMGIVAYALAIALYSLLSVWRFRRASR